MVQLAADTPPRQRPTTSRGVTVTIVAVHPTVTIVRTAGGQTELPTEWFPTMPRAGQEWKIAPEHQLTQREQLDQLNVYLARD